MRSGIAGTGSYLPRHQVDNAELARLVGGTAQQISRRTGIEIRHVADDDEAASDLALCASLEALQAAGCASREIDCIIFATHTPDYYFPGSGCVLGAKLGLVGIPALDVRNQCSGFLYGLSVADHFIRVGTYHRVLVVAAEVMTSTVEMSPRGRDAAVLYGDGAAAVVVVPQEDDTRGVLAIGLHADGRFARSQMVAMPGSHRRGPLTASDLEAGLHLPVLGGPEFLQEGYRHLREAVEEALETCRLLPSDIALFIPNQGCVRIARQLCRHLGLLPDRLYSDLTNQGNTAGASVPLNLDAAVRSGRVHPGDVLLLCSFGSGFTWAWGVLRW